MVVMVLLDNSIILESTINSVTLEPTANSVELSLVNVNLLYDYVTPTLLEITPVEVA